MSKVSILIPARKEVQETEGITVLERTVREVYSKAKGEFEVIVGFDGPPFQDIPGLPNLRIVRWHKSIGTKRVLNDMAAGALGRYIFKLDAHCALSEGFDVVLQEGMQDNWVVAPRFYVLNPATWKWQDERFYDYFKLPCPHTDPKGYRFQAGGHWPERTRERLSITPLDENMKLHGSSFFMRRDFFLDELDGLDLTHPDGASGEDIEISLKTWLGPWDGRVMVNKDAWVAHMHKGKGQPRSWRASMRAINASYNYTATYWMQGKWGGTVHDVDWLVERFSPVPGWPAADQLEPSTQRPDNVMERAGIPHGG